ncbi:MAG: ABC transporter ATP-binding protein [Planctomycetota bacterium]
MSVPLISAKRLSKRYPRRERAALDALSFEVGPGEIVGLLGLNGAGKTTLMRGLTGLLRLEAESLLVLGGDPGDPRLRARIGYAPEVAAPPWPIRVRALLEQLGRLSGLGRKAARAAAAARLVQLDLEAYANKPVRTLSKGEARRLTLAAALVHDPDLIVLDEPTDGVDPLQRRTVRDRLEQERARGAAVLVSSHVLTELETCCDRVLLLHEGRLLFGGPLTEMVGEAASLEDAVLARIEGVSPGDRVGER